MKERFIKYISGFINLTKEETDAVLENIEIRDFKKGSILLREGQISNEGYFVLKGCLRKYSIIEGEEKTTNFYTEEEWVSSTLSYSQKKPSDHFLSCIEDSILIVGREQTEKEFYSLFQRFPRLQELTHTIMEAEIIKYQEMLATFKKETPEQRYLTLLENRPELLQRVALNQLASYIGIKPESLSRIRKRILNK